MTRPDARPQTSTRLSLRLSGVLVAVMWLVAIIVTDGIEKGTTGNIITDPATAQQTILSHQAVIVIEAMSSCYLAALLVVFGAALWHALGDAVPALTVFGAAVLAAGSIILGAALSFAELAAAHHHDVTALTTLGYLAAFSFAWKGATWGFLLLATGWATLATKTAPRWFAIGTLVLGVPVVLGVGAVIFWALAPVWFALAGFLLTTRRDVAHDDLVITDGALPVAGP